MSVLGLPCGTCRNNVLLAPQVSVTAREDVPSFGPPLPSPPVFQKVGAEMGTTFQAIKKKNLCVCLRCF